MSGQFAGGSDLNRFWRNLCEKQTLITEIPRDHWDYRKWYDKTQGIPDKTYCKWGSFITDVDKFDAAFFNISPREAAWMAPQLRLMLQNIYTMAEDAGYINKIRGTDTGVFIGVCCHDYRDLIKVAFQIHCGPALGAFNQWVKAPRAGPGQSELYDGPSPDKSA